MACILTRPPLNLTSGTSEYFIKSVPDPPYPADHYEWSVILENICIWFHPDDVKTKLVFADSGTCFEFSTLVKLFPIMHLSPGCNTYLLFSIIWQIAPRRRYSQYLALIYTCLPNGRLHKLLILAVLWWLIHSPAPRSRKQEMSQRVIESVQWPNQLAFLTRSLSLSKSRVQTHRTDQGHWWLIPKLLSLPKDLH